VILKTNQYLTMDDKSTNYAKYMQRTFYIVSVETELPNIK